MRIISGKYKGKKLSFVSDEKVRPTSDMVKEAIFSILSYDIENKSVLDLFAGSGSLGIEALSRGADSVIFVDILKSNCGIVKNNLIGIEGNYKVLNYSCLEAMKMFKKNNVKFDYIFLDPPYKSNLAYECIDIIFDFDLLNNGGQIIFERASEDKRKLDDKKYKILSARKYGVKEVIFLTN